MKRLPVSFVEAEHVAAVGGHFPRCVVDGLRHVKLGGQLSLLLSERSGWMKQLVSDLSLKERYLAGPHGEDYRGLECGVKDGNRDRQSYLA